MAPGETARDDPCVPLLQVYVFAPEEFSATELPVQIFTVPGETATVGVVLTDTVAIAEFVQPPNVLVPVTVYTVVEPGVTLMEEPGVPGFQV